METVSTTDVALSEKNAEKQTGIDSKPRTNTGKRGFNNRNNDALTGDSESRGTRKQRESYNDYDRNYHYIPRTVIRGRGSRFGRYRDYENWNGSYSDSDGHTMDNGGYHGGRGYYSEVAHNGGYYHPGNDYRRRGFMPGPPRRRRFNPNLSRRRTDSDNVVTAGRRRPAKLRTSSETATKHGNNNDNGSQHDDRHEHRSANNDNEAADENQHAAKPSKDNSSRRRHREQRPYRTLPIDRVPRRFSTVLVSGIPKAMNENGLFHFMQCFGDVANIRKAEPATNANGGESVEKVDDKKDEEEKNGESNKEKKVDNNKSGVQEEKKDAKEEAFYSSYVTFYNKLSLNNLKSAKEPVKIFDNEVQIADYQPPPRNGRFSSKSKRYSKEKSTSRGIVDFGDKMLIKIFEAMDFHTRFNAQFVCRRWHKNMARVRTPAFDAPSNVTLRIKRSEKTQDRKDVVSSKFDAESRILTVSVGQQHYRGSDYFLSYLLNNIVHQFGSGIEKVEVSHVRLTVDVLLAIGLDSVSSIVVDRCTVVGGADFSVLHSFCSHLGDRLKVLNAIFTPWPGKISVAKDERRSSRTPKQKAVGGAETAGEKRAQ